MTRRAVLGGAAAVGAASVIRPVEGLAATLAHQPRVFSRWIGSLSGESGALAAPQRFALLGVEWAGPPSARIELRTRRRGGAWSRWALASVLGHDADGPGGSTLFGEAIWSGPADYVQLRASRPVRGLLVHFVSAQHKRAARAATAYPLATPTLQAGPGQPRIIARRAWADGQAPPAVSPSYGTIKLAFVHHSETPNGYSAGDVPSMILSIFDYHRYTRGFYDIAYNFAIDAYGRTWEARAGGIDRPVVGAHAGAYNTESTGVVVLGSFMDVAPSAAAIDALEHFLAWKLSLHGLPTRGKVSVVVNPADAFYTPFPPGAHVSLPRIAGHRDGDSTDCPGDAFYARLPRIRARSTRLAGTPGHVTLSAPSVATAGTPIRLSGRLALLGGKPIPGAPVEVQQLRGASERTIATATTAADGSWQTAVVLQRSALLRALHRPAPAVVSGLTRIRVRRPATRPHK